MKEKRRRKREDKEEKGTYHLNYAFNSQLLTLCFRGLSLLCCSASTACFLIHLFLSPPSLSPVQNRENTRGITMFKSSRNSLSEKKKKGGGRGDDFISLSVYPIPADITAENCNLEIWRTNFSPPKVFLKYHSNSHLFSLSAFSFLIYSTALPKLVNCCAHTIITRCSTCLNSEHISRPGRKNC